MIFSAIWPAVWTHCEYQRVKKNGNNAGYSRFFCLIFLRMVISLTILYAQFCASFLSLSVCPFPCNPESLMLEFYDGQQQETL